MLLDSWNPATDHQAMGRVWRDGQKLPVTIVRMISRDSIDEKVYQRQLLKGEFRDAVGGGGSSESSTRHFAKDEIKELFKIKPPERPQPKGCETADILRKRTPSPPFGTMRRPRRPRRSPCSRRRATLDLSSTSWRQA